MNWICKINGTYVKLLSPVTVQEYEDSPGVFRIKITDDITFIDDIKSGNMDYTFIKNLEYNSFSDIHTIEIYHPSDSRRKYKGAFKIQDCNFNPFDSSVIVKHTIWDDWAYLKSKSDTKVNALQTLIYVPYIQTITCNVYTWFEFLEMKTSDFYYHPDKAYYKSAFVDIVYDEHDLAYLVVYYTEKTVMERGYVMDDTWTVYNDLGNSIEYIRYPPGGQYDDSMMYNFTDFYDISYAGGYGQYVFAGVKSGSPSLEYVRENPDYTVVYEGKITLYDGDTTPKDQYGVYIGVPADWNIKSFEFVLAINNNIWQNGKVNELSIEYRGIDLRYFLSQILYYAAPSFYGSIKSTFLFNDHGATGEIDRYDSGFKNYVSNDQVLRKYVIIKGDFIRPSSKVLTTRFDVSLNDVVNDLKVMFPFLHNYIDKDGNYRIEHISYFNSEIGLDLRSKELTSPYSYSSENIINKDIFEISDSYGDDFYNQTVEYEGVLPIDDQERVNANTVDFISTDIEHMNKHLDSISTEGIVLVEVLSDNSIMQIEGYLSGYNYQNVGLSLSHLLNSYYGWNLGRSTYILFGEEKEAKTLAPIKKHEIDFIYDDYIDLTKLIKTSIGTGKVEKIEYSSADDNKYKVTLLYG